MKHQSIRASTAGSLFARAAYLWASNLAARDSDLPEKVKNEVEKTALAPAFAADASLDAVQFSARAMASNVAARRNTWPRNWEDGLLAQAKVAGVPSTGTHLFGDGLDWIEESQEKSAPIEEGRPKVKEALTLLP